MEVVVAIGLLFLIGSFAILVDVNAYRSYLYSGERDLVLNVLQKARSQAINNVCLGTGCSGGKAHGVHFGPGKYVVFQENVYDPFAPTNVEVSSDSFLQIKDHTSGNSSFEVVFNQLDGSTAGTAIDISDEFHHSDQITINSEGRIDW